MPAKTIINQKAISAELWVRYENFMSKWQHPFALHSKNSGFSPETFAENGNPIIAFGTRFTASDATEVWTHYVYTRIFDEEKQAMNYKVYINGVLKNECVIANASLKEEGFSNFYIGNEGSADSNNQFKGDMGHFSLYSGKISDEEIEKMYNESCEQYQKVLFYEQSRSNLKLDTRKLKFMVNDDVSLSEVDNEDISLTDCDSGNSIPFSLLSANRNEFEIALKQYLKYNKTYKISSASIGGYNYITVADSDVRVKALIYNANKDEVSTIAGNSTLNINLEMQNSSKSEKGCKLTAIVRDSQAQVIKIKSLDYQMTSGEIKSVNIFFDELKDADSLYIYAWEKDNSSLIPMASTPILIK